MTIRPFDHTADIGFDLEAPTLEAIYAEAARALVDAMTDASRVRPRERRRVETRAADVELLMIEWLEDLVVLFDAEGFLLAHAEISTREEEDGEISLQADVEGEIFDPERHPEKVGIKGITYHELQVRENDESGWTARVIFDI